MLAVLEPRSRKCMGRLQCRYTVICPDPTRLTTGWNRNNLSTSFIALEEGVYGVFPGFAALRNRRVDDGGLRRRGFGGRRRSFRRRDEGANPEGHQVGGEPRGLSAGGARRRPV